VPVKTKSGVVETPVAVSVGVLRATVGAVFGAKTIVFPAHELDVDVVPPAQVAGVVAEPFVPVVEAIQTPISEVEPSQLTDIWLLLSGAPIVKAEPAVVCVPAPNPITIELSTDGVTAGGVPLEALAPLVAVAFWFIGDVVA